MFFADTDLDGYGSPADSLELCDAITGYVADNNDCDDADPKVSPGEVEVCDGVDNNCDGQVDEGCTPVDTDPGDSGSDNSSSSSSGGCGCNTMRVSGPVGILLFGGLGFISVRRRKLSL